MSLGGGSDLVLTSSQTRQMTTLAEDTTGTQQKTPQEHDVLSSGTLSVIWTLVSILLVFSHQESIVYINSLVGNLAEIYQIINI